MIAAVILYLMSGGSAVPMETACKQEVVQLHQFFQDWFNGELPDTDAAFARFADVMADDFAMVVPGGDHVPRPALMTGLRGAHAKNKAAPCRIWIESMAVRPLGDGLFLVSYQEWQDMDGRTRGRRSTAVMQRVEGKPNDLVWLHVHETWMPEGS